MPMKFNQRQLEHLSLQKSVHEDQMSLKEYGSKGKRDDDDQHRVRHEDETTIRTVSLPISAVVLRCGFYFPSV